MRLAAHRAHAAPCAATGPSCRTRERLDAGRAPRSLPHRARRPDASHRSMPSLLNPLDMQLEEAQQLVPESAPLSEAPYAPEEEPDIQGEMGPPPPRTQARARPLRASARAATASACAAIASRLTGPHALPAVQPVALLVPRRQGGAPLERPWTGWPSCMSSVNSGPLPASCLDLCELWTSACLLYGPL